MKFRENEVLRRLGRPETRISVCHGQFLKTICEVIDPKIHIENWPFQALGLQPNLEELTQI